MSKPTLKDKPTNKHGEPDRVIITPGGPRPEGLVHRVEPGQVVQGREDTIPEVVPRSEAKSVQPGEERPDGDRETLIAQDYVFTPGGVRHKSHVHVVERGHILDASEGRLKKLDPNLKPLQDYGPILHSRSERPFLPYHVLSFTTRRVPGLGEGWIAYTGWWNNTGTPISSFSTTWTVPSPPLSRSGQLIYIFNGIQNSTYIYQPVLQWGSNGADGGDYWQVATWYVSLTDAFHSNFIRVNPGDVLTGIMTQTRRAGTRFDYSGEFQGIAGSGYSITNVEELKWACETLETYGVTQASDYPTRKIAMRAIDLRAGVTAPALTWSVANAVTDCGQEAVVVSNASPGGEVDLYCYDLRQIAACPNADGRLELFYTGRNDGLYHRWQVAPSNGWGEEWPLGFGNYARQVVAALNKDRRMEVFYVGTNQKIYHNWQTAPNNGWSGEYQLGGWAKQISVGQNADGRLEVFYVGTNDKIYHNWQTAPNNGWSGEYQLGGWAKQISVGQNADGRLEVFYVGMNDKIYHNWQTAPNNGWSGDYELGGWAKQITVARNADGRLEVFYVGTNDKIYHNWQTAPNNGWSGEVELGGWAKQIAVGQNADGRLELFGIGMDDGLFHCWQTAANNGWSGQALLGGAARQIVVGRNSDGRLELFYVGTNSVLYQNWQTARNNGWRGEVRV